MTDEAPRITTNCTECGAITGTKSRDDPTLPEQMICQNCSAYGTPRYRAGNVTPGAVRRRNVVPDALREPADLELNGLRNIIDHAAPPVREGCENCGHTEFRLRECRYYSTWAYVSDHHLVFILEDADYEDTDDREVSCANCGWVAPNDWWTVE